MLEYSSRFGAEEGGPSVEHLGPGLCFGLFTDSATVFAWSAPLAVADSPEDASAIQASPLSILQLLYPPKLADDASAAHSTNSSVYLQSSQQLGQGGWSTVYRIDARRLINSARPSGQAALKFIWRRSTDSQWAGQARRSQPKTLAFLSFTHGTRLD